MSYSTADEKYRKYQWLVRTDPSNRLYERKLQKYKNLASKNIQKGGNGNNSNPFAEPMTPDNNAQTNPLPSNDNVPVTGRTSELLSKINNMIAYSQQNGAGKKSSHGNKSKSFRDKTQVKGYRNMVGGDGDVSIVNANPGSFDIEKAFAGLPKPKKEYVEGEQKRIFSEIVKSIEQLNTAKTTAESNEESIKTELQQLKTQHQELSEAKAQLDQEASSLKATDAQQKAQIEQLQRDAGTKLAELNAKQTQLQSQLVEKNKISANAITVVSGLTEEYAKLVNQFDKQSKEYDEGIAQLKAKLTEIGITFA